MNLTDTNVCVSVYVKGGPLTERERERETDQTSTRLRETQPFYRSARSHAKCVMECYADPEREGEVCHQVLSHSSGSSSWNEQKIRVSFGFYYEIINNIEILLY